MKIPRLSTITTVPAPGAFARAEGLPEIRPEVWHGPIADYVARVSPHTEADPLAVYVQLLAGLGNLMHGTAVQLGEDLHPPLLWPLLCGTTATGRKGTSEGLSVKVLESLGGIARKNSGLSSGEGLIEAFTPDSEGVEPDPRLIVVESEWEIVLQRGKREGSTLTQVLRDAWDGRPLRTMNIVPRKADVHHLTVVGHITPQALREGMADKDVANGFLNRFLPLMVARPRLVPLPKAVPAADREILRGVIGRARASSTAPAALGREAGEAYSDWYMRAERGREQLPERVAMATARLPGHLIRTALILAVADGSSVLGARHIVAAGALVDYAADSSWLLFGPGKAGVDRVLLELLADGPMTRTEISKALSRHVPKAVLDAAVDALLSAGEIEVESEPTKGRTAVRYRRRVLAKDAKEAKEGPR